MNIRVVCLVLLGFLCVPISARAEERVESYDVRMSIDRGDDGFVQEKIVYDLGEEGRHGIFRNLPKYQCPGSICVRSGIEWFPPARNGEAEPYTNRSTGRAEQQQIGDANVVLTGPQVYQLRYGIQHGVVEREQGQMVSWNVTGDEWEVVIASSTFVLEGPARPQDMDCFVGVRGSQERACTVSVSGTVVSATLLRPLNPGEGWTVDVLYSSGTFIAALKPVPEPPLPYWVLGTLGILFFWGMIWWRFGKDARGRGTIIPEYTPPKGLKPYQVEALFHEGPTARGLTATAIDFAQRGFLKIEAEDGFWGKTYTLVKQKAASDDFDPAERAAFVLFFGDGERFTVNHSASHTRATRFSAWGSAVLANMRGEGWYASNVQTVRIIANIVFFGMILGTPILFIAYVNTPSLFLMIPASLLAYPFVYGMPKLLTKGALVLEHIQGFKRYINVAEKDRLAFHDAPQKTPERFSELLPFAIALGEEKAWAKVFEDVGLTPQQSHAFGSGMSVAMVGGLSNSLSSGIRSSVASSGDGGGGSSGGGGGGGGGGSW